ncbi:DEAD/DEAH box helicase [Aureibaculum marinum]|uniref:DEAD/DEAH box helicase n=1 Tax=Aureibaculum marinum TaxID=2487930 RepID=A0A3N4NV99_9FLAO|nr:DEAD/DEAH box helicase [Aureibaculum marinum]RPD99695.1 DEAD/DEAH box helicase [Aureibaculum marinum]
MQSFDEFKISKQLSNALDDFGFITPTPIQSKAFSVIASGKNVVGIAQTGTGKTLAYLLPILQQLKFSKEKHPRVLVLVPTRELVVQVAGEINKFGKYLNHRVFEIYGGTNINAQKAMLEQGCDIIVATPGRLYDLVLSRALTLKAVKKLVIDEVDVMLDLGFRFQLTNLFDLLPANRQNIMFSATMTEDVDVLINDFFIAPVKITIALSGTPLDNIMQRCYAVPNFYTKVNLLVSLLKDVSTYKKVLIFVSNKRNADRLFESLDEFYNNELCVIHSNKTQNYRLRSMKQFNQGDNRILVTTDVMARGLDLDEISHVINFDTPKFPENYMHRIGRTGRAAHKGESLLFYTEKEHDYKNAIEHLMGIKIKEVSLPENVEISKKLIPEEQPKTIESKNQIKKRDESLGSGFHEKSDKNKKVNKGGSYQYKIAAKYKKPKTRGDKNYNKRNKKK